MFSVSGDARSLSINFNMLICVLLYNNVFKNSSFLFLIYQNDLKYNTHAMTISKNIIMTMICGYTILIGKYYQQLFFVDGYPRVLTFKYHDGGCNLIQIHCCRWRSNIPSPVSDQVCHAIVKPQTANHMKV